jgi:hypothetical protein
MMKGTTSMTLVDNAVITQPAAPETDVLYSAEPGVDALRRWRTAPAKGGLAARRREPA